MRQIEPAVLPRQTIANTAVVYAPIPTGYDDLISIHIAWFDATSAATIVLQTSNYDAKDAPLDADETAGGSEHLWATESGVSVVGPSAAAAGCSMLHLGNYGAFRSRLKITATADCDMEVLARRKTGT